MKSLAYQINPPYTYNMTQTNTQTQKTTEITFQSPIPRKDKKSGLYVYDTITLYNVKFEAFFEGGSDEVYVGTTTRKGKKFGACCPSKVISLKTY